MGGSGLELPPLVIPRRRAGPSSLDEHRVSHRLLSKDLCVSPDGLSGSAILESYPTGTVNLNVAEILSEAGDSSSAVPSPVEYCGRRFAAHRDTFALLQLRGDDRPSALLRLGLPRTFFERLERFIDFDTYLSMRLSCRCWSAAISSVRPPRFATVASPLPVEIIQRIYAQLSPVDFNAARHFCRSWMLASLSHTLLVKMLRRGGWWGAARADRALIEEGAPTRIWGDEWLLSKRLSTECSLRRDWTGNGLGDEIQHGSKSSLRESSLDPSNGRLAYKSFILDSEVDFSALTPDGRSEEGFDASSFRFTISVCGKYLLVTRDCTIYIYSLNSHASIAHRAQPLSPVERLTSLACPHRVLAVNMDTSSDRFALAVLLEGRAGFVCDLRELGNISERPSQDASLWDAPLWDAALSAPLERQNSTISADLSDTSSVFGNLGSTIDPPFSVAVCAHRRCIAFGSSTAVELHWDDALTGQDLNRRFSIPAGGEILYFFPERKDEKKMRVIGSRAVPDVWRVGGDDPSAAGETDYYNAIPLSDGTHVLFANRFSARLCLGIETAPTRTAIDAGYMRLEPRVIFEGPRMHGKSEQTVPKIYEAARDMRWGARIVAGFGDEVWVFAVPGDFLREKVGNWGDGNWKGCQDDDNDDGEGRTSVLRIGGIRIGEVEGLNTVGICADGGGVLVRGIGRAELFKQWRLTSRPENVKRWVVQSDGSVFIREEFDRPHSEAVERDADGDVLMRDYIRRSSSSCYDDEAIGVESANYYDDDDDEEGGGGVAIEFDLDGDVIMPDVGVCYGDGEEEEEPDEGYFSDEQERDGGTLAIHPAVAGCWRNGGRMGIGRDEKEDLWELSRVEVEVFGGCKG